MSVMLFRARAQELSAGSGSSIWILFENRSGRYYREVFSKKFFFFFFFSSPFWFKNCKRKRLIPFPEQNDIHPPPFSLAPRETQMRFLNMVKAISQLIPEFPILYFKILDLILCWVNSSRKNLVRYSELYNSFMWVSVVWYDVSVLIISCAIWL